MLQNERGLTLIEILAAIAILSIIGVIIWSIFFQGYRYSQKSVSKNRLQQEANFVVNKLTRNHQTSEETYTINSSGCKITVLDSTGTQIELFESSQLCYQALSNGAELDSEGINPNNQDLKLEITVYEKENPRNTATFETLLYRLKEGDFHE